MKVKALDGIPNSGILAPCGGMVSEIIGDTTTSKRTEFDWIEIKKGRYLQNGTSHPLRSGEDKFYKRIYGLEHEGRAVYWFDTFGDHSNHSGYHVSFSWMQQQNFLWKQNDNWLQKEENVRYIVNVVFLVIGVIIGLKQL